jgi:hypothetical protein
MIESEFKDDMNPRHFKVICQWCGETGEVDLSKSLEHQGWKKEEAEGQFEDQETAQEGLMRVQYWLHTKCYQDYLKMVENAKLCPECNSPYTRRFNSVSYRCNVCDNVFHVENIK